MVCPWSSLVLPSLNVNWKAVSRTLFNVLACLVGVDVAERDGVGCPEPPIELVKLPVLDLKISLLSLVGVWMANVVAGAAVRLGVVGGAAASAGFVDDPSAVFFVTFVSSLISPTLAVSLFTLANRRLRISSFVRPSGDPGVSELEAR